MSASREEIDPEITEVRTTTWKERNKETIFRLGDLVTSNSQSVQGVLYAIEGFKKEKYGDGSPRWEAYVRPVFSLWQMPISRRRPKWDMVKNMEKKILQDIAKDYADLGLFLQEEARRLAGDDNGHNRP